MQNRFRGIAQLVEQRSPKPRVQSSSLCAPAIDRRALRLLETQGSLFFLLKMC